MVSACPASTRLGSSSVRLVRSPPSCSCLQAGLTLGVALLYGARSVRRPRARRCLLCRHLGTCRRRDLYGVVSSGLRTRETLLPLLFLPVVAPVLLAATKAWDEALAGTPGRAGGWLDVLVVFAVLYIAIGTVAFGPLLEDG